MVSFVGILSTIFIIFFFFFFFFFYATVWLEVSLVLFTSLEVLSIVMYDLSRPNPPP